MGIAGVPRVLLLSLIGFALIVSLSHCRPKEKEEEGAFPKVPIAQRITLPGLMAPVEVVEDRWGIPHIYARTNEDLLRVSGFLVARDRFFQMESFRRVARGELSALFGPLPPVLETDLFYRVIFMGRDGRPQWDLLYDALNDEEKSLLNAYVAGINAYIRYARLRLYGFYTPYGFQPGQLLGFFLPRYLEEMRPWEPQDVLAIARFQQWNLSARGDYATILLMSDLKRNYPEALTTLVFFQPPVTMDHYNTGQAPLLPPDAPPFPRKGIGSNNWVVSPQGTAGRYAMLANDPHLLLSNPSLWYIVHYDSKTLGTGTIQVIGVTFPGIPVVLIGYTPSVAFGATVLGYQVLDLYGEELDPSGTQVLFQGRWVPLKRVTLSFPMPGGGTIQREILLVPHHGPIVPGLMWEGKPVSLRWTGQEVTWDLRYFRGMNEAENLDQFFSAVTWFAVGAQNFVSADRNGEIGYYGHALVPQRSWNLREFPPYFILPGTGVAEWEGWVPDSLLPKLRNPSWGYILSANHDVLGTLNDNDPLNGPFYSYPFNDPGFRARRIEDLIKRNYGNHTTETFAEIQADSYSIEGAMMLPILLNLLDRRQDLLRSLWLEELLPYLRGWGYTAPLGVTTPYRPDPPTPQEISESIGASIFHTWEYLLRTRTVFDDELRARGVRLFDDLRTVALIHLLQRVDDPSARIFFDNLMTPTTIETPEEIVAYTLWEARELLTAWTGSSRPADWAWGKVHKVIFRDFFGQIGLPQDVLGPFPRDGADRTVDPAYLDEVTPEGFLNSSGPSMRLIVELKRKGAEGYLSFPGGQVFNPHSEHYQDLLPYWLNHQYIHLPFTLAEVSAKGVRRILFLPGD
jgi:penicillin amidase